jgi:4-amino-4-deoxy-L-arabinose transferase-like glycosyltransferase
VARHVALLLLVAFLTFFAGLGRAAIGDSDEAFYAEASREMVESGDWLTPYYNYELRFQKPILYYWLVAATYTVAGVDAASARFPAAAAGLLLVLVAYTVGRRWYDAEVGLVAGLVTATSFGYYFVGRLALPDLPLALFIVVATWGVIESMADAAAGRQPAARWWLLAAAAAAGLGFLTKGPVAVALPALVAAPLLARDVAGRRREGRRWLPWSTIDVVAATALFLLIAMPWYLAMAATHGVEYLHRFFVGENLDRFATDRYNEPRSVLFYVPVVFGGLMPWSPFALLWIPRVASAVRRRLTLEAVDWRLVSWALLPLLFYSVSIGKQPRYVLPILPPLAVLLAASVVSRLRAARCNGQPARGLAWMATLAAVVILLLGLLLQRAKPLLFALDPSTSDVATGVVLFAGLLVLVAAWVDRQRHLVTALTGAAMAVLLALHYSVYSAAGLEPVQRVAALHATHAGGVAQSGTYRVFVRNLVFYTGLKQTDLTEPADLAAFLASPDPVLVVTGRDELEDVEATFGVRARRLGEVLYFNPSAVRVRTLLWPDPENDLETVVLVTNR